MEEHLIRKPWRDLYFYLKEVFESEYIGCQYLAPKAIAEKLNAKFGTDYQESELEHLLGKYFKRNGKKVFKYFVPQDKYHILLHEIHNQELPAELLPFNYKHQ